MTHETKGVAVHSMWSGARYAVARVLLLGVAALAAGCAGETALPDEEASSREGINRGWRGWWQMSSNSNGFSGSAAICPARTNGGNPGDDSSGFFVLGRDASSSRYRISLNQFFTQRTAWVDFGTQTFGTKATCATLDDMYQTPPETWNNQVAVLGRSINSKTFYIRVVKPDTNPLGPGGIVVQPSQPTVIQNWVRISNIAYDSAPAATVYAGYLFVVGRLADNRLNLHFNWLNPSQSQPFSNANWGTPIQVPALPSPLVAQGDPAISNTAYVSGGWSTILTRAKNSSTNAMSIQAILFDDLGRFGSWIEVPTNGLTVLGDPAIETDIFRDWAVTVYFRATDQLIYQASGPFAWSTHPFIAIGPDAFPSEPSALGNTGLEGSHIVVANKAVESKNQMFDSGAQAGPGD